MRRLALVLGAVAAYAFAIRPRIVRWGATDEEVNSPFPGQELMPNGKRSSTMAVTIDAPPGDVWPRLLQNASDLERGWEVVALEPERFLCLRASVDFRGLRFDPRGPRPSSYSDSTWSFLLKELPGGKTRLIVSGYREMQPRWLLPIVSVTTLEWAYWIVQMRHFANLKRMAEAPRQARRPSIPQDDKTAIQRDKAGEPETWVSAT